jgi:ankyrin repeat protein
LYWAVVANNKEMFQNLCNAGVDPSMVTKKRESLLYVACALGHTDLIPIVVNAILRKMNENMQPLTSNEVQNLDIHREDRSQKTALDRVAENGDVDTLVVLVNLSIYPKESFVVYAAYNGRTPCVEFCIEQLGMPIDARDSYKKTALLRAVEGSHLNIARYLNIY